MIMDEPKQILEQLLEDNDSNRPYPMEMLIRAEY